MLLKSIRLSNFRQFQDASMTFADGKNGKNVTLIIGDNGTGKTTFAQAFLWCLYGETSFSDKNLLNTHVARRMTPSSKERVEVELVLSHGTNEYRLIRSQNYRIELTGKIRADNSTFDIARKGPSGNTEWEPKTQCERVVNGILPKELSRYFFFDGERIEKMSKDISTGKKADDFAAAVKGLLGLNGMASAIQHFNPRRNGVISTYDSKYDQESSSKIQEYTRDINACNERINEIDEELDQIEDQINEANSKRTEKIAELKQYEEGKKIQEEKERLENDIASFESLKSSEIRQMAYLFNSQMDLFFSMSLLSDAMEFLSQQDIAGKDIPFINDKTIEYLLDKKVCICGTHLDEGTAAYIKVKDLLKYVPPQSVGSSVSDFKKSVKSLISKDLTLPQDIRNSSIRLSELTDKITSFKNEVHALEGKLSGEEVQVIIRQISSIIQTCDETIRSSRKRQSNLEQEKGAKRERHDRLANERKNLNLQDDKNKKIEVYKAYAERIYDDLQSEYTSSEAKIRRELEDVINHIFKTIYEGGLKLGIDEKYHITVYSEEYNDDVETSTAQSISVIFAFITGIIKMAKENRQSSDSTNNLLSSEPYPLVMDAPLSSFDKKRIKTVCEAIPDIAEQVIIFIKDTDGDLAEQYMGYKIGSRHSFDKKDEFRTDLV